MTNEPLAREDACRMMHTALRKACDSKATSIAYNVISIVCALAIKPRSLDPWLVLGELVADAVNAENDKDVKFTAQGLKECVARLDDEWWKRNKKRKERDRPSPDNAQPSLYALVSVFRTFDASDYNGMAAFLVDEY